MKKFILITGIYITAVSVYAGTIVSVTAVGDMRFNGYIGDKIKAHGFEYPFKQVQGILSSADIAYGNFECAISSQDLAFEKKYVFKADPEMVKALTAAGFDIVDLANNHSGDYGEESFIETMRVFKEHGLLFSGAGMNIEESRKPVIIERNGLVIAFLSYSNTLPDDFWATKTSPGVTPAYLDYISADVGSAKMNADIVVVCYHGGDERSERPKQSQIDIAHAAIDAGASLVLGHHPHVLQGIEMYKGVPIIYSLGNFMFLSLAKQCYDSMIVTAQLSRKGIETLEVIPVRIGDACIVIPSDEHKMKILHTVQELSYELGTDMVIKDDSGYVLFP
ncbi:MAG: CapA family protein [bacterium]